MVLIMQKQLNLSEIKDKNITSGFRAAANPHCMAVVEERWPEYTASLLL